MGAEARIVKDRTCIVCQATMNVTATDLQKHFTMCIERLAAQVDAKHKEIVG